MACANLTGEKHNELTPYIQCYPEVISLYSKTWGDGRALCYWENLLQPSFNLMVIRDIPFYYSSSFIERFSLSDPSMIWVIVLANVFLFWNLIIIMYEWAALLSFVPCFLWLCRYHQLANTEWVYMKFQFLLENTWVAKSHYQLTPNIYFSDA